MYTAMKQDNRRVSGRAQAASHEAVVQRAEAVLRDNLACPVAVSTLSRIVGRSERGLREAFYTVRGMSPKQYERTTRL